MTQATTESGTRPKRVRRASTAQRHHFLGVGGVEIFFRVWRPETDPRAVVVISHGFNSHSGFYEWAANEFVRDGLAVYAIDHRGRGESDGERYFVNDVLEYVEDLSTLVGLVKTREPGLRIFLLGHSAGGVISCVYALEHGGDIDGLICESFAFKLPVPDFAVTVVKGISHIAPHARVLKLKNKFFSRDPEVIEALSTDPFVANEKQPSKTVAAMARADDRLKKEFSRITLPVFIIHGTDDKVTVPAGSQFFFDHTGSSDKSIRLYEGHYHDLLNDIGKERVIADIESWINARTPSLA